MKAGLDPARGDVPQMTDLQNHRFADIFPAMSADEFTTLVDDVRRRGQRFPVVLHQGKILDGRNRYRACRQAGVDCRFETFTGNDEEALAFVVSTNVRRDLTATQRAFVAREIEREEAELARQRMSAGGQNKGVQQIAPLIGGRGKARDKAAKRVGVNRQYVSDAKKLAKEAPYLAAQCRAGKMTITQAKRKLKEQKREARREENRQKVAAVPGLQKLVQARFATITIDPPWDWGDESDVDQFGRTRADYATMSIEKLLDLPVAQFADTDCHLYMWITNRSLPKGYQLLGRWGFRYITCLTWVKPTFGTGNYFRGQTEQVLFGVKGSQALKRKDVGTAFHWPRGGKDHSRKPAEFYELVESCSPGPYFEMFSRCARADWTSWGEDSRAAA